MLVVPTAVYYRRPNLHVKIQKQVNLIEHSQKIVYTRRTYVLEKKKYTSQK